MVADGVIKSSETKAWVDIDYSDFAMPEPAAEEATPPAEAAA